MGYISIEKLENECKAFFYKLIDNGKGLVEITEFNAELHKIIKALPKAHAIEWNSVEKDGLPLVSDEYIVMIAYADKPTVLDYDADEQVFFHEVEGETELYKVTHWAEMPGKPDRK